MALFPVLQTQTYLWPFWFLLPCPAAQLPAGSGGGQSSKCPGCTSHPSCSHQAACAAWIARGRGVFTATYGFSQQVHPVAQKHTQWWAWGKQTEGRNVLKNGFICGDLSKSSSVAQEEAWLWELCCTVSSWLTEHIPEILLLGGMPSSDFFFFKWWSCFKAYLYFK